jgi:hypothetical protein
MLPSTPEAWIFISVSCLIGFLIGQWLRARKKRQKSPEDYIEGLRRHALAETRLQAQKAKKPHKKKAKPSGGA